MRQSKRWMYGPCLIALAVGCGGTGDEVNGAGLGAALAVQPGEPSGGVAVDVAVVDADGGAPPADGLECSRGPVGDIEVVFDCESVWITSCKDLSNVVIEFADGDQVKTEDLTGTEGTFAGTGDHTGDEIVGVWVKAGRNASGDGPGYGERFDAPADSCDDDSASGGGDEDGSGGSDDGDGPGDGGDDDDGSGVGGGGEEGAGGGSDDGAGETPEQPEEEDPGTVILI